MPAKAFFLSAAGWGVLLLAAQLPWGPAVESYKARRAERAALALVAAEAERLGLTFPQVVIAHPAHAGKPVYWPVTCPSPTAAYASGRPGWPIIWTNPERVRAERLSSSQERVLARVAAVKDETVYLDFVGRP